MAESERASILTRIRHMVAEVGGASDAQLLDRFAASRDEAAFELLLWRHARLVFGVCRRVLHDVHDAEDAFQATFLALARHAGRIARREALAGWLHKVAYHVALTARRQRIQRSAREQVSRAVERVSLSADPGARSESQELEHILDQEIGWLPERFRAAVVLCYLEGKSVDEAAMLLGCPRGTVASRLARARERLRARLARRGFGVTAGLELLAQANAAPQPLFLIPTLTAAALRYAAGGTAAAGIASPRITALTEEVLRAMFLHKLKTGIAILTACIGVLLAGGGLAVSLYAQAGPGAEPQILKVQAEGNEKQGKGEPGVKTKANVTVSRPTRREAAPFQEYTGRLEARQAVDVHPRVSGVVQKVCFKSGAEVKKGDVLFELESQAAQLALEKAEADLIFAEAKRQQAGTDVKRTQELINKGLAAREELDKINERTTAAEAAIRTARVDVTRARLDLESTKVTAPMSGQAGRPQVDPGALVFRGQDRATLLTTVTALDPIGLVFEMDELSFLRYRRLLREKQVKGAGSSLQVMFADEDGYLHQGTLEGFEDRINPQSGTVRVRGTCPNPGQLLLPGMFAQVRMTFGPPRAVLQVPEAAIRSDQDKKYVLVVGEGNIAERRPVTLGWADNGMRVIDKGLGAEDWVVVDGPGGIHPGDRVEPRKKAGLADRDR